MQQLLTLGAYQERQGANQEFLKGNYSKAIRHLIALKQMLVGIIDSDDRIKLNEIESKFIKIECAERSVKSQSLFNKDRGLKLSTIRGYLHKIYTEYNDLIMDLLQKKDLLLKGAEDKTKLRL